VTGALGVIGASGRASQGGDAFVVKKMKWHKTKVYWTRMWRKDYWYGYLKYREEVK
jgi:hypothetical protein